MVAAVAPAKQQAPVDLVLADDAGKSHRDRPPRVRDDQHGGKEIFGPRRDEGEHGDAGDAGRDQRHHDAQEDRRDGAPSISAASSISRGTEARKERIIQMAKGRAKATLTITRLSRLSTSPTAREEAVERDEHDDARKGIGEQDGPVERGTPGEVHAEEGVRGRQRQRDGQPPSTPAPPAGC